MNLNLINNALGLEKGDHILLDIAWHNLINVDLRLTILDTTISNLEQILGISRKVSGFLKKMNVVLGLETTDEVLLELTWQGLIDIDENISILESRIWELENINGKNVSILCTEFR